MIFLVILLLPAPLLSGCSRDNDIIIGAVIILSTEEGLPLKVEREVLNGMEFAIQRLNAGNGINGRHIKLYYRDCKGDPALAQRQFRELATVSPSAIINIYSHITEALVPLATELQVPQLATLATADGLVENAPYSIRYWPNATAQSCAVLPIVESLQAKKLCLVHIDNTYGNSVAGILGKLLREEGVQTEQIPFKTIDATLEKELSLMEPCDAIHFTCFPQQIGKLAEILRKIRPDTPLIGPNSIASPHFVQLPALDRVHLSAPLIYNPSYPYAVQVGNDYVKEFSRPLSHYSGIGFDMINLLAQILEEAGPTPDAIMETVRAGFVYPGIFGDVVNELGSNDFGFPMYPAQIVNKHVKYMGR